MLFMSEKSDKTPPVPRQKPDKEFSVEDYSKKYKISERSAQRKIKELLYLKEIIFSKKIRQKNYYKYVIINDLQLNKFSKYQKSFLDNYIPVLNPQLN